MNEQSTGTKLGERRSSARAEAAPAYRARREEIIAAAGQAFLAKGYRATSFRDIADAVGVDRASLYYYFESKHELFRAATTVAVERNVADAESIAASDQTAGGEARRDRAATARVVHRPRLPVHVHLPPGGRERDQRGLARTSGRGR